MRARFALLAGLVSLLPVVAASGTARGQAPTRSKRFQIGVLGGVSNQSKYVESAVAFSDGGIDFISIQPETGLSIGLCAGYRFTPRVTGYLALIYANADADYVEDGNFRPQVEVATTTLDAGALFSATAGPKFELGVGGGISLASQDLDGARWNGNPIGSSTSAFGLHLLVAADFPVSANTSIRGQFRLAFLSQNLSDLEQDLAVADGELSSRVDEDTITDLGLAAGVVFAF